LDCGCNAPLCEVIKRMRLDNLTEWRITSTIQSIEPWDEAGEDDSIQS